MRLIDADAIVLEYGGLANIHPYDGHGIAEYFANQIRAMPTIEPERKTGHWIPCKERLPEIGKEVLLSEPNVMFIAEYHGSGDSEGLWLVDGCCHYLADVNGCAWMPLPEPYAERREE